MENNKLDSILKDRMIYITTFADALVYLIDTDNAVEDNDVIIKKASDGVLCDYIYEKYGDTAIFINTFDINRKRYLDPLYKIGFEEATARKKYAHAKNNGLLNVIGVTFDIIANWDNYTDEVLKELQNNNL